MPDPETQELQLEQLERERAERKLARFSHEEPRSARTSAAPTVTRTCATSSTERAESEDEVASDEDG